jgi:thiazole/oxazole-forming peptide maturase SagD family component
MQDNKKILEKLRKIGLSDLEREVFYITDEPKIPYFYCFPSNAAKEAYNAESSFGQGHHTDPTLAKIKATAELLERLCLDNPQKENLEFSFYKDDSPLVDPVLFCCYSKEQIKNAEEFKQKTRLNKYSWYPVKEIISGKQAKIPAQLVFLPYIFDNEFQIRGERISTGAALGEKGTERAFISGFLEVVERDACIYAYLTKKNIPRIIDSPERIKNLEEYLKRYNLEPYIFDVTSDLEIPTALAITLDRTGVGPAVEVGSASSFNYEEAIYKAILESVQCRRSARLFDDISSFKIFPKEEEIVSLEKRFVYWQNPKRIKDIEFWVNTENNVPYSELNRKMKNINSALNLLKNKGYHVFVADITLPKIKQQDFEVLKVIIPELHPLYLDERAKMLFSTHYGSLKDDSELKPHPLT